MSISPVVFTIVNSLAHEAHHLFQLLQLVCLHLSRAFEPVVVSSISTMFGFCVRVPKALSPRHCAASWTKQSARQRRLYPGQGAVGVRWGHPEVSHEGSLGHVPRTSQHALSISKAVSVQFFFCFLCGLLCCFSVLLVNFLDSYLVGCCMLHVCGWDWRKPCIEWAGVFYSNRALFAAITVLVQVFLKRM